MSCNQSESMKDSIIYEDYCDSCNRFSGYYFSKYYNELDPMFLDTALGIINNALKICKDPETKYIISLRKVASLCGKQQYDKSISFLDSIDSNNWPYEGYKQVLYNRINAMKCQQSEDICERNRYLQNNIDLLSKHLERSKNAVDSIYKGKIIFVEEQKDSITLPFLQYYYYKSVLVGKKKMKKELDSLRNNNVMSDDCYEHIMNNCQERFMVFTGL